MHIFIYTVFLKTKGCIKRNYFMDFTKKSFDQHGRVVSNRVREGKKEKLKTLLKRTGLVQKKSLVKKDGLCFC